MAKKGETVRYFKEQFEDEEVLLVFRKHPVVMRKALIYSSIGLLIPTLYTGLLTAIYENNPEKLPSVGFFFGSLAFGLVLAVVIMFPFWISWFYSVYIVTDQRLIQITQKGMFHRSMVSFGLHQIQMINYEIGGFEETVLGFGTIVIQTYVGSLTIHHVHHPAKIQKEILHILRDQGYDMPNAQSELDGSSEMESEEA